MKVTEVSEGSGEGIEDARTTTKREIVVPGELLSDDTRMKAGEGAIKRGRKIFSSVLGIKFVKSDYINVMGLRGAYIPRKGDIVIGNVIGIRPMSWLIDIGTIEPISLHVRNVPWRVGFGDTKRFLNVGDAVMLKIANIDSLNHAEPTMKGKRLRKLSKGHILRINCSKVPRLIGKGGSMISLIRGYTQSKLFVAQNGWIWVKGRKEMVPRIKHVIGMIEENAHEIGLTNRVKSFLMNTN